MRQRNRIVIACWLCLCYLLVAEKSGNSYDHRRTTNQLRFFRANLLDQSRSLLTRRPVFQPEDDGILDRDAIANESESKNSFWPPWPFSELNRNNSNDNKKQSSADDPSSNTDDTVLQNIYRLSKITVTASVRNLQEFGSQMWFHLPPAAPPLMLLGLLPRSQTILVDNQKVLRRTIPLFQNSFARSLALSSVALGVMSWAHSEIKRKKRLTTLPIPYKDLHRAILPPFLPEQQDIPAVLLGRLGSDNVDDDDEEEDHPSTLPRSWKNFRNLAHEPEGWRTKFTEFWKRRQLETAERRNAHRLAVYDELVALQALKKKRKRATVRWTANRPSDDSSLGFALVTGASKGIGRAIAVELARWEIPLILVARDEVSLKELAYDIENCYGVECYCLPADLAHQDAPERIYETVHKAGLKVDILVNNAGFSSHGPVLNHSLSDLRRMVQVNSVASMSLTHLFGRDMRDRRRGRVLMVSSICGVVSGIATVATYSATKAFENSFSISLAKEMEPHGVGVTCLMPGAVKDTEFGSRSNSAEALCWKVPFYAKTAPVVAEWGVRSMLLGETECTPGVMNRIFVKVMKPIMPQRIHNLISEIMWKPLQLPFLKQNEHADVNGSVAIATQEPAMPPRRQSSIRPPSSPFSKSPRVLKLEQTKSDKASSSTSFIDTDETEELRKEILELREQLDAVEGPASESHSSEEDGDDFKLDTTPKSKQSSKAIITATDSLFPEQANHFSETEQAWEERLDTLSISQEQPTPSPEPQRSRPPFHGKHVPEFDNDLELLLKGDRGDRWPGMLRY